MIKGIDEKFMMTFSNRSSIGPIIKEISDIAYSKYIANAYVHCKSLL